MAGRELTKEQRGEGDGLQIFLAKHLNVEIGLKLSRDRWRGADMWEAAADPEACGDLEGLLASCEVCVAGVDGGGLDDLLGLCIAGRERGTQRWLYWFRAWAWPEVLELRKSEESTLRGFAKDGDLILLGRTAARRWTTSTIRRGRRRRTRTFARSSSCWRGSRKRAVPGEERDRARSPRGRGAGRRARGGGVRRRASGGEAVAIGQGFRLSSAVWSMERKLKHRMLAHSGAPMMGWCVSNAKAEQRGNAVLITKQTAGRAKIDPLIAGFNATKLLEGNPVAKGNNGGVGAWLSSLRPAA
jgi:phage terminase large subunit-like protein